MKKKRESWKRERLFVETKMIQNKDMYTNYLKHVTQVFEFFKREYDLTQSILDCILFVYDQPIFSKEHYKVDFNRMQPSCNKHTFSYLERKGYISVFRKTTPETKKFYIITDKTRNLVNSIYSAINNKDLSFEYIKEKEDRIPIKKIQREVKKKIRDDIRVAASVLPRHYDFED